MIGYNISMQTRISSLQFGGTTIEYQVNFTRRKTIAIDVLPEQQITITAPEGSELAAVEAVIRRRAGWILQQQRQFANYALLVFENIAFYYRIGRLFCNPSLDETDNCC